MKLKLISGILAAVIATSACVTITHAQTTDSETAEMETYYTGLEGWFGIGNSNYYIDFGAGTLLGIETNEEEIIIPEKCSASTIWDAAFYASKECPNLKKITIPASVTVYKELNHPSGSDFIYFPKLEEIVISENDPNYITVDGVLLSKDKTELVYYPCGKSESVYTVPSYVKTICPYAFERANNLSEIIIPNTVTKIGNYAFDGLNYCKNLTKISFPDSIEDYNALGCTGIKILNAGSGIKNIEDSWQLYSYYDELEELNIPESNPYYSSVDGVVFNKDKTKLVLYPGGRQQKTYTVPDTVKTIAKNAFCGNENISEIILPDGLTTIESSAFSGCKNLSKVNIPVSAVSVPESAFSGTLLEQNGLPEGITGLDTLLDESLTEFTVPKSVNSIQVTGEYAGYVGTTRNIFQNSKVLEKIDVEEGNQYFTSVDGVLYSKDMTRLIAYPINKAGDTYTLPETVKEICGGSFQNNKHLSEVIIPNGATAIGVDAFHTSNIKKIDIPESVAKIGMQAFSHCEQLEEVVLSGKISQLKESTFYGCKNLKTITLPDTLTSMEWGPFCGCESLTEVELPAGLTNISDSAFKETSSLKKIVIPSSVTDIAWTAFQLKVPDTWNSYEQPKSLTIFCNKGSYAESFAKEEGISFFYIENLNIPAINGGANHTGKLEAADSAVILQKVLNSGYKMPVENATDDYLKYIDVDLDGKITASDATQVMQKVLNSSYKMPIER